MKIEVQIIQHCHLHEFTANVPCLRDPRDPTGGFASLTIDGQGPPYPVGTNATFTCPCGYEWSPDAGNLARDPNWPPERNRKNITITCYGTMRWMAHDLTECLPGEVRKAPNIIIEVYGF